jgi:hypothetical protein
MGKRNGYVRRFRGNIDAGNWRIIGAAFDDGGDEWRVATRVRHDGTCGVCGETGWAGFKVAAKGWAEGKANYHLNYNFVEKRFSTGREISSIQNARPRLLEEVMIAIDEWGKLGQKDGPSFLEENHAQDR